MKKTIFTGAGVAIVTPMRQDGSINLEKFKELIDFQLAGGTDALIVCGTTGESATQNHEEHVEVIKTAVEHTAGRAPIIAGTGSNDTAYALALSKEAEALGVDGLLMVTPYYNKTSQAGLIRHFTYVADRVDIPIILYNVPSRTGCNIQPATYAALADHPNIVATKEASGNMSALLETIALCGDKLDIYSGNDDQVLPVLSLGGKGVISVLSNIAPRPTHEMVAKYLAGDLEGSRQLQVAYAPLIGALFSDVNPIPVKEALNLMGWDVGPCRMPLAPMSDAGRENLRAQMEKIGLL